MAPPKANSQRLPVDTPCTIWHEHVLFNCQGPETTGQCVCVVGVRMPLTLARCNVKSGIRMSAGSLIFAKGNHANQYPVTYSLAVSSEPVTKECWHCERFHKGSQKLPVTSCWLIIEVVCHRETPCCVFHSAESCARIFFRPHCSITRIHIDS